jgi:spore germination protein KA
MGLMLPAVYIAIVSFHFAVIPNELLLPMKTSVQEIPYPPIIEAFIMELTIELIREAVIRLPTSIGTTIAIEVGLVIGEAVVKAGLISNIMIIVVALTAIATYLVPSVELSASIRILRFPLMIASSLFGFFGISLGFLLILIHLCKIESFGIAYFSPLVCCSCLFFLSKPKSVARS